MFIKSGTNYRAANDRRATGERSAQHQSVGGERGQWRGRRPLFSYYEGNWRLRFLMSRRFKRRSPTPRRLGLFNPAARLPRSSRCGPSRNVDRERDGENTLEIITSCFPFWFASLRVRAVCSPAPGVAFTTSLQGRRHVFLAMPVRSFLACFFFFFFSMASRRSKSKWQFEKKSSARHQRPRLLVSFCDEQRPGDPLERESRALNRWHCRVEFLVGKSLKRHRPPAEVFFNFSSGFGRREGLVNNFFSFFSNTSDWAVAFTRIIRIEQWASNNGAGTKGDASFGRVLFELGRLFAGQLAPVRAGFVFTMLTRRSLLCQVSHRAIFVSWPRPKTVSDADARQLRSSDSSW